MKWLTQVENSTAAVLDQVSSPKNVGGSKERMTGGSAELSRRVLLMGMGALLGGLPSCARDRAIQHPKRAQPAHPDLPPEQLATAAGIWWMLAMRPQTFWKHPVLGPRIVKFVPVERRLASKKLLGFDPANLEQVLGVGYRDAKMWVLQGVRSPSDVERTFDARLHEVSAKRSFSKTNHWIVGRGLDGHLRGFARLGVSTVALESGSGTHVKAASVYLQGKLAQVPTIAKSSVVSQVQSYLGEAPLRAVSWGPFDGEWGRSLGGMLRAATAVAGAVSPGLRGELALRTVILGDWGADVALARQHAVSSWSSLATSAIGRLLGLHEPELPPKIVADRQRVQLDVVLDGSKVLSGFHKTVRGALDEIFAD